MSTTTVTNIVVPTQFRSAEDNYSNSLGSGDWIKLTGDVVVHIASNTHVTVVIERSGRDPLGVGGASVAPVHVVSEYGQDGISPIMLSEPYIGWWRVTVTELKSLGVGVTTTATTIVTGGAA